MLNNFFNFIKKHLDFKFYIVTIIALVVGISIIPMLMYMPQKYGYENGILENIQMTTLFIMIYFCLTSKTNKKLFKFIPLVLSLLIIREVNCGRTLFFPIPDTYHQYYSWRDLPWPWLGKIAHFLYGTWFAIVIFLFFKKKIYLEIWNIIKNTAIPFWNLIFTGFAMFMGIIAEDTTNNNFIFEEGFELLFYVSILGFIWLYSRNKNFIISSNTTD